VKGSGESFLLPCELRYGSGQLDWRDKITPGLMARYSESFPDFIVHNLDLSRVIYT